MSLKRWRRWLNSRARPGPRPPVAPRPPRPKAWLRLEEFETRLAPSCSSTVAAGVLTVSCDSANNTVTVDHAGTNTTVDGAPFADASFTAIRITTGTGGGTVNLNATPAKPTTVNAVSGNPAIVELSPTAQNLDTIQGAVTVNGAAASGSELEIHDQTHAAATTYALTASSVARPGAVTITYSTMSLITVNGGSGANAYNVSNTGARVLLITGPGNDVVNVTATSPGGFLDVRTGSGTATVNLSPTAHNLDAIQGDVSVLGGGPSTLVVNDQAHTANTTYALNPLDQVTPVRPGAARVTSSGVDFVTVNGGSGANTYNVFGTDAGLTTLNTGNGNDVVNATATGDPLTINGGTGGVAVNLSPTAHNLGSIGSDVAVNGGSAGLNSLTLNDQARTANLTYTLTGSSVFWSGAFAISFNNRINTLTVNGGSGANTYEIDGTGASTLTTLTTGNGNDVANITATSPSRPLAVREGAGTATVNVSPVAHNLNAIQGGVTVNGGTGTDTLNINDQAHNISATYTLTASSVARPGAATITYGSLPMNFVTVNVGGGHNTCNVTNTGALNLTTLNTVADADAVINVEATAPSRALTIQENGGGDGLVNVSPTAHNLDAIQGTVTVNPVSGFANVVVNDQAHTANTTYTQSGATLTRPGAATITYGPSPGGNVVTVNGGSGANTYNVIDTKATRLTTLNTGNGNDVVNVESTFVDINGSHSLTVNGGTGGVAVNLSPTAHNLDDIRGDVTVNGGSAGFSSLTLNDQAFSTGNDFFVSASVISRGFTPAAFRFNQINTLIINGSTGTVAIGNTFDVQSIAANTAVTIHAGGRDDTITVGNAANTLDDIRGPLTVDGQAGTDTLNINDQGSTTPHLYSVTSTRVIRAPGGPTINYSNIERLNFHSGRTILPPPGNGNTVDVESTDANTAVEIAAGGDITVNVGNDQTGLDDLQGPVLVLAQGDPEDMVGLNVNDQMTAGGQEYSLAQGDVTRTGAAPVSYEGIQAVVVNGGGGGNLFDVDGVSPGTPATINTGLGNNLVRMRQHDLINDALVLNGQGTSDALGYRAYTTDVYVNLQTGTATDIASFTGIHNLTGGGGNNILVGDGTQDSITGGTGRNLLISGGGSGTLTGGGAGDILIGGITAYDQDPDSLAAILAYWAGSTDDYATRVANLRQGNGVPQLEAGISVFDGGAANTLTGNGDETQGVLNLFYVTEAGSITDQQPDEVAVDIDAGTAPYGGSGRPSRFRPLTTPAGAAPDERSGQLGPTAHAAPQDLGGPVGLLPHGARPPHSVEPTLALDLVWCGGWQPFGGLDLGTW